MTKILIFCSDPDDREFCYDLVHGRGLVYTVSDAAKASVLLETLRFALAIMDLRSVGHHLLKDRLAEIPCLLLADRDEEKLKDWIRSWPYDRTADYFLLSSKPLDVARARRTVAMALELARLKEDVADLASSKADAEQKLKKIYTEMKDLGGALTSGFMREMEKRAVLEARYAGFLALKQKIENIVRKIYAAEDVTDLLNSVLDIKDVVRVSGVSIYIREDSEALGGYLKPLVWDDAYLVHSDFARHAVPINARDFAADAARTGESVCPEKPTLDPRCASRYLNLIRTPLRSLLCLPLKHESDIVGVLELYNRLPEGTGKAAFTAEDRRILLGLTEHIAMAMTKLNLIQYDALTGLLRPDPFFQKVMEKFEVGSKRRQAAGMSAMVMGDVDWFKHYNDRNGQEAGNRLLQELGSVLKSTIREGDLLCRYGGEEFLFFLTGIASLEEATVLTERIRKTVEDHVFEYEQFQPRCNLTMSFGVTMVPHEEMGASRPSAKAFLKTIAGEADLALAEAKGKRQSALKMGEKFIAKNRVCAFVRDKATVMTKTSLLKEPRRETFVERRTRPRFPASTLCLYRDHEGHKVAATVDLSVEGAALSTESSFARTYILDLFLILGSRACAIRGEVVYSRRASPSGSQYFTGIRFRDLGPSEIAALEAYFLSLGKREIPLA